MNKKEKRCITPPTFRQPSFVKYFILYLATVWAKLHYRVRYNKESLRAVRAIRGPVLVVGSHHSALDFAFMVYSMFPRRMSIVVASNLYYTSMAKFIRAIKTCIPKKQFASDPASVMDIRKMLNAGVSVAIFPAGRHSITGKGERVSDSVYKLVKWLKVPVIVQKYNMSYQTRPRYAPDFRRGKVIVETEVLLTAEDCVRMSTEEIKAKFAPWFRFNDFEYQERTGTLFKSKAGYAKGLEDLLYKCPKCGLDFVQATEGNTIFCKACGNKAVIDGYGKITPVCDSIAPCRIDLWCDFEYEELKKEIISNPDYSLAHQVRLAVCNTAECGFKEIECGQLVLDKTGLVYRGTAYPILRFRIPDPPSYSIDLINRIDIFGEGDNTIYRFFFDGPEKPAKLNWAIEIIYDRYLSRQSSDRTD
jgi:1-acyl-sn-glycerol-3-phosphate acyltransferase/DNA-directed RNA polymerase subunit RPC12/RpoP